MAKLENRVPKKRPARTLYSKYFVLTYIETKEYLKFRKKNRHEKGADSLNQRPIGAERKNIQNY